MRMTRGRRVLSTSVLSFFLTAFMLPCAEGAPLVAWWKLDDTSDSAPGGTRPLTLKDGATLSGGALVLNTDPSNNRAATSAFNPTNSFSVFVDFQANTVPTGGIDPQYTLLSNIGNDALRFFGQFEASPGYMLFFRPDHVWVYQKTAGTWVGAVGFGMMLPDATERHAVVANWEFSAGNFTPTLFLDGSANTATSGLSGPMNFGGGATTSLILGTNVDEEFNPPRTLDGSIFEVAIFDGLLTPFEVDVLAQGGVAAWRAIPEPTSLGLLALGGLALLRRRRRR